MPDDQTPHSRFEAAVDALRTIVAAREGIDQPPASFVRQWWEASDAAVRTAHRSRQLTWRERRWLNFIMADRAALDCEEDPSVDNRRAPFRRLVDGYLMVAADRNASDAVRHAAAAAVLDVGRGVKIYASQRDRAKSILGDTAVPPRAWVQATGLEHDELQALLRDARALLTREAELPPSGPDPLGRATNRIADLLAASANPDLIEDQIAYDRTEGDLRVAAVSIDAFRGVPDTLTVEFRKGALPTSAVIFGDNGTGKSTIVDAIEFGLQARVGRSTIYDSPVGPALGSLARTDERTPRVTVTLSDNTTVERRLQRRPDGVPYASGGEVRPGFRLAPITLKRQDILRFLDTDGLSRGQIFFDYFPTNANDMAVRPEEQLQRLEFEAYELRIRRGALHSRVADHLSLDEPISGRDQLVRLLRDKVTGNVPIAQFDWSTVDAQFSSDVQQLLAVMSRLSTIKKERDAGVQLLNPVRYRAQAAILARELAPVGDELTKAFKAIAGADHVDRIEVLFGQSGPIALDVVVQLANGSSCFPQQLFSEGYRDLLAFLFFTSVAKRAATHGQAKILILDDVFQSVDAAIRAGVMSYLLREFADWQLIITVHDRLWLEYLRSLLRGRHHPFIEVVLRRWDYSTGPLLGSMTGALADRIRDAVSDGDPSTICAVSGRVLEEALENLSGRLRVSIQRRPDDRYTIGDLWGGVQKALKKTVAAVAADEVSETLLLRNLAGAHYNEWAESLSYAEAERFAQAVANFVDATRCPICTSWVSVASPPSKSIGCSCGNLTLSSDTSPLHAASRQSAIANASPPTPSRPQHGTSSPTS